MDEYEGKAREIGAGHGRNAASWVFDGNTTQETYAAVLAGIEDSDPLVLNAYRTPSLSGEFADEYSEDDLAHDLGVDRWSEDGQAIMDDAATAYNDAASEGFWHEVERMAREALS